MVAERKKTVPGELKNEVLEDELFGETVRNGHRVVVRVEVALCAGDSAFVNVGEYGEIFVDRGDEVRIQLVHIGQRTGGRKQGRGEEREREREKKTR
jgi:hypothetical protein